jgi:hypothetical protein
VWSGRGANLLEVGRDGGEGEDLEAEDIEAVLRVVVDRVLFAGGGLTDHGPASHHRVSLSWTRSRWSPLSKGFA